MKILGLCGSLRANSYNRQVLQIAKRFAQEAGHELLIDADLNVPLYNDDVEKSGVLPPAVQALFAAAANADMYLIASPEYNHSYSGVLKNAIDWLSRGSRPLKGKVAVVFGASNGTMGTVRAQRDIKPVLQDVGLFVLAKPEVYVRDADNAFDEKGMLKDQKVLEQLKTLVINTLEFAKKIRG